MRKTKERDESPEHINVWRLILVIIGVAILLVSAINLYYAKSSTVGFMCLGGIIIAELLILFNSNIKG